MKKIKVQLAVTIEVDAEGWDLYYDVPEERLAADVAEYVKHTLLDNDNFLKITVKENTK